MFIVPNESDGFRPVINLKKLNSCVEYKDFKMDCLFLLNELPEKYNFLCKLDQTACLFFGTSLQGLSKICKVSIGGEVLPIYLSVLWPLLSPKDLYKAYESPNINFQEVEHSDNSPPGRHILE